ncbi:hypothetical protein JCM8547_002185 [Rhodosporidiobolus lusitaniae]
MSEQDLHDCAICPAKTASRCSSCKAVYFCSREHQKLIWSVHKWTCGNQDEPFSFPPLSTEELAALEKVRNADCTAATVLYPSHLHYLRSANLLQDSWKSEPLVSWKQACVFSQVHTHLRRWSSDGIRLNLPVTGWREMYNVVNLWYHTTASVDLWHFVSDSSDPHPLPDQPSTFAALSPFFRQNLIFRTLRLKPNASAQGVELLKQRSHPALASSGVPEPLMKTLQVNIAVHTGQNGPSWQ